MLNDLEKTAKGCQELFMRCSSTAIGDRRVAAGVDEVGGLAQGCLGVPEGSLHGLSPRDFVILLLFSRGLGEWAHKQ